MLTGMYIPRLELVTLDSQRVIIGDPPLGAREVLFVFDTICPFCGVAAPTWNDIAAQAARRGCNAYGLSLGAPQATARYAAEHGLRFPILLLDSERNKGLLRAEAVPQTLVVGSGGLVLLARPGVLTDAAADSIVAQLRGDHTAPPG
jgi:peroxiredoxin